MSPPRPDAHRFWRDPALPFLEARAVDDGRAVCYGLHSHPSFAIGVVTGGRSEYRIGPARHEIATGAVVLMNPEEAHACNPLAELPWSYRMLYVDAAWLAGVQRSDEGGGDGTGDGSGFVPYRAVLSTDPLLFGRLNGLFVRLFDTGAAPLAKEQAAIGFFADLHRRLGEGGAPAENISVGDISAGTISIRLRRAADYITSHCTRPLRLSEICAAAGLSPSYLVRAFKARYGLTPHAYQINRRIQFGQRELRRGRPIVDVALDAGFADQAHFQRAFKRHVAATPGQYAVR